LCPDTRSDQLAQRWRPARCQGFPGGCASQKSQEEPLLTKLELAGGLERHVLDSQPDPVERLAVLDAPAPAGIVAEPSMKRAQERIVGNDDRTGIGIATEQVVCLV